jgi:phage replication initiation protein
LAYQEAAADEYAKAAGRSTAARTPSALPHYAGRDGGAIAPTERAGAVERQRLVPILTGDSTPSSSPINNMGENLSGKREPRWSAFMDEHLGHVRLVMTDSGEVKTVMVRRPTEKQICIIDWINFTVSEDTWCKTARQGLVSDEQFVTEASRQLEKIFGFGVTAQRDRGMNFYRESWVLGDNMGFVCFGGQRSTMLITVTGHGCLHALPGWERRLHDFLTTVAIRPSISRIDLAHDDFDGSYLSVDWADAQYDEGGFTFAKGGRPPGEQKLGSWKRPSGKGRTFTVGLRSSSKYVRFYEKGRKEGDRDSNWCRCEIEFKNTNTVIRPEVLLNPSFFFVDAYPCMRYFEQFGHVNESTRFEVKQRAAVINHDAAEQWLTVQCGKYIRVWRELYGDKEALDRLCCADDDFWPKRLKPLTDSATSGPIPIHKQEPVYVPGFLHFIKTVPSFGLNGENGFA